ncbi:hypothetical protein ACWYXJ_29805 [Janthinobacterium lividum]
MQKNRILKTLIALTACLVTQTLCAQASASKTPRSDRSDVIPGKADIAASSSITYTLGDLADIQRDVEFEKQRRALRDAKGAEEKPVEKPTTPVPARKIPRVIPKPVVPEGIELRGIFGVKPDTTVRFFTAGGQFEDRQVGESVQGWTIHSVESSTVILQKGRVLYPLALKMRSVSFSQPAFQAQPVNGGNSVQAGPLPSPRLNGVN